MWTDISSAVQAIGGNWGNHTPDYFGKVTPNRGAFSSKVLGKNPRDEKENMSLSSFVQKQLAKQSSKEKNRFLQQSGPTRAVSPIPRGKSPLSQVEICFARQEECSSPALFPATSPGEPSPFFIEKSFISSLNDLREFSLSPFPGSRTPSPFQLDDTASSK